MNTAELLAFQLHQVRLATLDTFNELAPGERLFQPRPGLNHPLWLLGHIATSEDHLILDWCAGRPQLPEAFNKLFGIKSAPLAEASAYPPVEEILDRLARVHQAAQDYVRKLPEGELDRPNVALAKLPPAIHERFGTKGRCILGHLMHEAGHSAQMAYLRRMLGKPFRV